MLLGKRPSTVEVDNDLNSKMTALFRVLVDPVLCAELERKLFYTPYSRTEFFKVQESPGR